MKQNKVVLITGVSSGFGKFTAEYLKGKGYIVYGFARTEPQNYTFHFLRGDVTHESEVGAIVSQIIQQHESIDVLINNAGSGIFGAIEDISDEAARKQFDVNVFGALNVIRAVLPGMRERNEGVIINITSMAGIIAVPFQGHYSASKGAMESITQALRFELIKTGVNVVSVVPGDFKTDFTANRTANLEKESSYYEKMNNVLHVVETDEQNGADVLMFARKIESVICTKRPLRRYLVGAFDQRLFTRLFCVLPCWLREKIVADHYKAYEIRD